MQQINHWAIEDADFTKDITFVKNILKGTGPKPLVYLKDKIGDFYSNHTLNELIQEEATHSDFTLSKHKHRSIRTFSSGEQKKALLNHLLSKNPDFLIIENTFDMLDMKSQKDLLNRLVKISETTSIIQIFKRKDELLPFIQQVLKIENNEVVFKGTIEAYNKQFDKIKKVAFKDTIPAPLSFFDEPNNPLIQFKNVSVKYINDKILNTINWEIKQGEFWQLIGPNGAGKTTLLTMLIGDNPKAFGQDITLFGRKKGSGESVWEIKKKIGYVTPAMTVLFKGRHTVENMVISGLHDSIGLYQLPTTSEKRLASKWIDIIGLTDFKHHWFSYLSEQQQCMVLIARAMIKHPPLLILDEPSHGLNDYNIQVLTALVNKISKESKTAIIYVSHKKEKGLNPNFVFELIPSAVGSKGVVKTLN